jgi:CheY-like chemotaxis protein
MPGLDGWSVASQVASGALPRVPILLITAGESDAGYPVPTRYVLRKPLAAERLLVLVREMVRAGA